MLRYNIVQKERVNIIGSDSYYALLHRDSAVITEYIALIRQVATTDLKSLSLLSIRTQQRPRVLLDLKSKCNISHNELQECLFSALRIVKRDFAGKLPEDYTRVVNHRRFKIEGSELTLLPQHLVLHLSREVQGSVGAIRLHRDHIILHRTTVIHSSTCILGIDLGSTHAIAVLKNDTLIASKFSSNVDDLLDFISHYEGIIKVGYPGKLYKSVVDRLYYKLLRNNRVVIVVNESYTSKICSNCGGKGLKGGKIFFCPNCGIDLHADINSAINIARR